MALLFDLKQKLSQGFSALWKRYPNKSGKQDAEKAYGQVVKTPAIDAEVHQALDWQIPHWETLEWYHPPYLATYLRKGRFKDDPPAPKSTTTRSPATAPAKTFTPGWQQQQDAHTRLQMLIDRGMSPEDAKQKVYREIGWVKE